MSADLLALRHRLDVLRRQFTINVLELANELDDLTHKLATLESHEKGLSDATQPINTNTERASSSPQHSEITSSKTL